MYKQQQREALEKALESMNSENYKAFACLFADDIYYQDLKKVIMDYFDSIPNSKHYTTLVWDMVELSNQIKENIKNKKQ